VRAPADSRVPQKICLVRCNTDAGATVPNDANIIFILDKASESSWILDVKSKRRNIRSGSKAKIDSGHTPLMLKVTDGISLLGSYDKRRIVLTMPVLPLLCSTTLLFFSFLMRENVHQ
jgi:hypothetical protein